MEPVADPKYYPEYKLVIVLFLIGIVIVMLVFLFLAAFRAPPDAQVAEEHVVALTVENLAQQQQTDRAHIEVISTETATWLNNCLEAPAPNESCSDTHINGYRITLKLNDDHYIYHTDITSGAIRLKEARNF